DRMSLPHLGLVTLGRNVEQRLRCALRAWSARFTRISGRSHFHSERAYLEAIFSGNTSWPRDIPITEEAEELRGTPWNPEELRGNRGTPWNPRNPEEPRGPRTEDRGPATR